MPHALFVPLAALPVIERLPVPVVMILENGSRQMPLENCPVPKLVPLTARVPLTVLTVDVDTETPQAKSVPLAALPVIERLPVPVVLILERTSR